MTRSLLALRNRVLQIRDLRHQLRPSARPLGHWPFRLLEAALRATVLCNRVLTAPALSSLMSACAMGSSPAREGVEAVCVVLIL